MREEMASLGLPEPQFREDGFSFVITFRSIAPREGVMIVPNSFRTLLERGVRDVDGRVGAHSLERPDRSSAEGVARTDWGARLADGLPRAS
ncbi:MAG: hypothetical protein HYU75_23555 [Betaproteobacteria bacterium]|nr:hypothetical protein [Betaproteobacteria bacterium]